jgi:asparagine synthase (glutamine-hydrolysing)
VCGIAGIFSSRPVSPARVTAMTRAIRHRGPDDEGCWIDPETGIGLGHRRLSIVDLTPSGHQPMVSANGRYVLTFNGEIYNHRELRRQLEQERGARAWRGHSDTETFLEAIAERGLVDTLRRSVGMFGFALWDRKERALSLVRDRLGEKPLYYGWAGGDFLFGSELKALRTHPRFDNPISRAALGHFVARSYVPAPLSIYHRVYKLLPGCVLTVEAEALRLPLDAAPGEGHARGGVRLERYWSYRQAVADGLADPVADEAEAVERLETVLVEAVRGQSMADVPIGAFLSGGVDSSTVVALYQKYSSIQVRTFSIGFAEAGFDEARHAKSVAQHLGTIHDERYVSAADAMTVIPALPTMYDEPFADSSQIPTHVVSRFAREQVSVALSGDGGDELFGGYNRHVAAARLSSHLEKVPAPLRASVGGVLGRLPPSVWTQLLRLLPGRHPPHLGMRVQKGLRAMAGANGFQEMFPGFLDGWAGEKSPVVRSASEPPSRGFDLDLGQSAPEAIRMMYADAVSYLPDSVLCKVDRASMAVSLETRAPFLDHRVTELAARIPLNMKISGGKGKQILRRLLHQEVPAELVERPKTGFAVPVGEWIKGPLRPWAEDLLDATRMAAEGWLDPAVVQLRWHDHLSGRRNSAGKIWAILMFQAWLREQGQQLRAAAGSSVQPDWPSAYPVQADHFRQPDQLC